MRRHPPTFDVSKPKYSYSPKGSFHRGGGHGHRDVAQRQKFMSSSIILNGSVYTNHYEAMLLPRSIYVMGISFEGNYMVLKKVLEMLVESVYGLQVDTFAYIDGTYVFTNRCFETKSYTFSYDGEEHVLRVVSISKVEGNESMTQFYNVLIREGLLKMNYKKDRDRFFKEEVTLSSLSNELGIELRESVFVSMGVRVFKQRPMWVLNIHPMYKVDNVLSLYDYLQTNPSADFKDQKILTVYNNRTYVFEKFEFGMTPNSTFSTGKESISFYEYYKKKGIEIKSTNQPMVLASQRSGKVHLVPEMCRLKELPQRAKERLPIVSSLKPMSRVEMIRKIAAEIRNSSLGEFFHLSDDFLEVKHVQVPKPFLLYSGIRYPVEAASSMRQYVQKVNWREQNLGGPSDFLVLALYDRRMRGLDNRTIGRYYDEIVELFRSRTSFSVHQQSPLPFSSNNLSQVLNEVVKYQKSERVVLLAFISKNDSHCYNMIANHCAHRCIIKQCILFDQASKSKKLASNSANSIRDNIFRQVINKHGYVSYRLDMYQKLSFSCHQYFLVVGIDVYHSFNLREGRQNDLPSKAAIVAKAVTESGVYFNSYIEDLPQSTERLSPRSMEARRHSLTDFIEECLNSMFPPSTRSSVIVLIYRDGLNETQIESLSKEEINAVKKANCAFIYSVVQKRTTTRFFLSDESKTQYENLEEGTLITDATDNHEYPSFFLVPVKTNISTSNPVKYVVVHMDNNTLTMDQFRRITWGFHHTYQNWPGPIKIPDVVQYAHKLAYYIGETRCHTPINQEIRKMLFYI
ncbi:protein aubergine-like [Schistocerca gregaria]|uniref:protein aubergine-like n=1 Tax=Schistocerca gregaria TaxID=7010 RepID=UPI00211DAA8E|nr:protein aubergine-like [Schistocerca gregaria]